MYQLGSLLKFKVGNKLREMFYKSMVESVLSNGLLTWYGHVQKTAQNQKMKKICQIEKRAKKMKVMDINFNNFYQKRVLNKIKSIMTIHWHPLHKHFVKTKSNRLVVPKVKTNRYRYSFVPHSIATFNSTVFR